MLLPAFIVSLAKHSPVQLGEKAFTKGRTFCVVRMEDVWQSNYQNIGGSYQMGACFILIYGCLPM